MNKIIEKIISEEINRVLNENFPMESGDNGIGDLIKNYLHKHNNRKKKKKLRKLAKGGSEYYDYDDYEIKNKKISKGDTASIISSIDTEKTNIAAVARELFPDHTDEGAQSQLRKILNGERPMTKNLASKIEKMISAGQIAVK